MMDADDRAMLLARVRELTAAGWTVSAACVAAGISRASYDRWAARFAQGGIDALADLPRSGRPPQVELEQAERNYLRKVYVGSNLNEECGSMTFAARWAAKNPDSPLRSEVRAAILKPRSSKHTLPVEVRRACRASEAVVARSRQGSKAGRSDGIYTPGWLRMSADGSRRLSPGERIVGDDASVNVGVCVPWARGGDKCSDRYGCRVGRFQLLAFLDCATDMCTGYQFVMRDRDSYNAADVCSALYRTWTLAGYAPDECVMEGGAWQAERTRAMLDAAGVRLISAKGRPNQKLIEGWFNRLWTVLSVELPPRGQVGRFRGEMAEGTSNWMRCRSGSADPREYFPGVTDFLSALDRAINYLNAETIESREYGSWTPAEVYAAQAAKGHAIPPGLKRYGLPVRERRKVGRGGSIKIAAECGLGWTHQYLFAGDRLFDFVGADVRVSFDPARISEGAVIELAAKWRDVAAGTVLASAAECISAAPELLRVGDGWIVNARDSRRTAAGVKRSSLALIGAQSAALDAGGVRARYAEHESAPTILERQYGMGASAPAMPRRIEVPELDLDEAEDFSGREKMAVGVW